MSSPISLPSMLASNNSLIPTRGKSPSALSAINNLSSRLPPISTQSKPVELISSSFAVDNYQSLIDSSSIENELYRYNYTPVSKIVVKGDNNRKQIFYIKAVNKNAQKVFIIIDSDGYTSSRSGDLTLMETKLGTNIPHSIKIGAVECIGNDICGVAFECGSDSVCILSRGDDIDLNETNFVYVEKSSTIGTETEGTIMSYPVVRLSEIRANPDLVVMSTDIITRRLRNITYDILTKELQKSLIATSDLQTNLENFTCKQKEYAIETKRSLDILEDYNNKYNLLGNMKESERLKHQLVLNNLEYRNDAIEFLLRSIKHVSNIHLELNTFTHKIQDIQNILDNKFCKISSVISD